MKSRSLFLAVSITLAAACATLSSPSSAHARPSAVVSVAARTSSSYAASAERSVNRKRHRRHRHRLHVQACLTTQAQAHADAMARSGRLDHLSMPRVGSVCGLRRVGEDVAYGFPTGRAVVNRGWMHSTEHRHNLLSRHFRAMGLAAARGADGTWYVSLVLGRRH